MVRLQLQSIALWRMGFPFGMAMLVFRDQR